MRRCPNLWLVGSRRSTIPGFGQDQDGRASQGERVARGTRAAEAWCRNTACRLRVRSAHPARSEWPPSGRHCRDARVERQRPCSVAGGSTLGGYSSGPCSGGMRRGGQPNPMASGVLSKPGAEEREDKVVVGEKPWCCVERSPGGAGQWSSTSGRGRAAGSGFAAGRGTSVARNPPTSGGEAPKVCGSGTRKGRG